MDFSYKFPAVKGIQAGKEFFIAMIPLRLLSKLFGNDDEYVPQSIVHRGDLTQPEFPKSKTIFWITVILMYSQHLQLPLTATMSLTRSQLLQSLGSLKFLWMRVLCSLMVSTVRPPLLKLLQKMKR